ncbi:MAG TPA: 50S ribosomal protein L9 [Patescibacteria group bacterium]|nr:50S ribosomal protein L9 [Patescibacteria group bacterium]
MQIVLVKKVKTLGNPGEVKNVARGYATNFLIPQGFATPATPGLIKEAKIRSRKFDKAAVVDDSAMVAFIKELEGVELAIKAKANEKGNLFASIHAADIVEELAKKISKSIDEEYIMLKEPIKKVGEYEVEVKAGDKKGILKLKIEPQV